MVTDLVKKLCHLVLITKEFPSRENNCKALIQLHEWIVHFFKANCCHGAMAAINFCVVGECEKLGLNAANQNVKIASREIRSPDASIKQHIAAYCKTVRLVAETNMPG